MPTFVWEASLGALPVLEQCLSVLDLRDERGRRWLVPREALVQLLGKWPMKKIPSLLWFFGLFILPKRSKQISLAPHGFHSVQQNLPRQDHSSLEWAGSCFELLSTAPESRH